MIEQLRLLLTYLEDIGLMGKKHNIKNISQPKSNDLDKIEPKEDIKTEPGQPTFKQALQTVLKSKKENI